MEEEQRILMIKMMGFRIERNLKELKMAELDRAQCKSKLDKIESYIRDLNHIVSEHVLEIQNELVELKMMISPESFKTVQVSMADLMGMLEKDYGNLQDVPSTPLRMKRHESHSVQTDGEGPESSNEEGRAD